MQDISLSWTEFKSRLALKNLTVQHIEHSASYTIWAEEGLSKYITIVQKDGGADQTDFDTNYKAGSNFAIGLRPYAFATGDFDFAGDAPAIVEITAGTSTGVIEYKFLEALYVNGGEIITKDATFGDWVKVEVVDKDNILGYGAGTVLKTYVKKRFIVPDDRTAISTPYAGYVMAGLWMRATYTSVGIVNPKVALNLDLHRAI